MAAEMKHPSEVSQYEPLTTTTPTVIDAAPEPAISTDHAEADTYGPPKGALAFSLVVLAGFTLYWVLTYIEIVIARY